MLGADGEQLAMTMRVSDIAPVEAQLAEISERLFQMSAGPHQVTPGQDLLLDPDYLDAAKSMLAALSTGRHATFADAEPLTEEEISTYLDFDPAFARVVKTMLRDFIRRTESVRNSGELE
jgi:hypothetical protein